MILCLFTFEERGENKKERILKLDKEQNQKRKNIHTGLQLRFT